MKVRQLVLCLLAFISIGFLIGGCAATKIRYECDPPESSTTRIKGLPETCKGIELLDRLGDYCPTGDTLVLVVKADDAQKAYKLSVESGKTIKMASVDDNKVSNYWDKLHETGMSTSEKLKNSCMMNFCGKGVNQKYGFEAEKNFGCNDQTKVVISYQFQQDAKRVSSGYNFATNTETSTTVLTDNKGVIVKFVNNDDIIDTKTWNGSQYYFDINHNVRRGRYYLLSDSSAISSVPSVITQNKNATTVCAYNLNKQECWGAEMFLKDPNKYVDFGVTPDKNTAVIVINTGSGYSLMKMAPQKLIKNIRLMKTVNK